MKIWTLDFETYWDTEYSLSKMPTDSYILDRRFEVQGLGVRPPSGEILYFTPEFIPRVLAGIPWGEVGVLCQNTAFDGFICRHHYKTPQPKLWLDTMGMARFALPDTERASLANLAKFFGLPPKGAELIKTRGRRVHEFTMEERMGLAGYCKHDVRLTWAAFERLMQLDLPQPGETPYPGDIIRRPQVRFPARELRMIDLVLRMFIEPKLHLDEPKLQAFLAQTVARKQALLQACGLENRDALMSNERFAQALESLGVEPPVKISPRTHQQTWAFSKKDPEFNDLLEHEDDRVSTLVAARLDIKSTGDQTRTERLLRVASDRRPWPVMLNFCGAKQTQRLSGGNKQNPQNLRRGGALRDSIVAPPGYMVVVVDSSQIEARCNAAESGQMDLVQAFRDKVDVYADLASTIYGFQVNKKEHPLQRQVGKTGILGLGYGMGGPKFQLTLKTDPIMPIELELDMCEKVKNTYRDKYSRIPEWWRTCDYALQLVAEGVEKDFGWFRTCREGLVMPNGFIIRYAGLHFTEHKGKRGWFYLKRGRMTPIYGAKVVENVTQHIAYEVVGEQMVEMAKAEFVAQFHHQIVLMSHDEVVAVAPEETAHACKDFMLEIMHRPPVWTPVQIPVAAEGDVGYRYSDAK